MAKARTSMLKEGISQFIILSLCFCKTDLGESKVKDCCTGQWYADQTDIAICKYGTWKCTMMCPYWSPIKHVTMAITELMRAERNYSQHFPWLQNLRYIYKRKISRNDEEFTDLRSPSGSKGAWHQEGASGGRGPFCGESMLHCCHRRKEIRDRIDKRQKSPDEKK